MNKLKGLWGYLSILGYAITKEVGSRILSAVFFPIALLLQERIIKHMYSIDETLVQERTWTDAQKIPTDWFLTRVNKIYFFLWMFLDDSTAKDSFHKDGTRMYSCSDNQERYPEWVNKLDWYWLRATYWAFWRNNTVNYVSWFRTGGWTDEVKTYWGEYNKDIDKNDSNSYYVPGMYLISIKHVDGNWYPYFTYVGEMFGRKIGSWQGRSSGSGRFSFSVRA